MVLIEHNHIATKYNIFINITNNYSHYTFNITYISAEVKTIWFLEKVVFHALRMKYKSQQRRKINILVFVYIFLMLNITQISN